MKQYNVKASNFHGTYSAGRFCAENAEEAKQMARDEYRNSGLGRALKDVGAFRFWIASDEDQS